MLKKDEIIIEMPKFFSKFSYIFNILFSTIGTYYISKYIPDDSSFLKEFVWIILILVLVLFFAFMINCSFFTISLFYRYYKSKKKAELDEMKRDINNIKEKQKNTLYFTEEEEWEE